MGSLSTRQRIHRGMVRQFLLIDQRIRFQQWGSDWRDSETRQAMPVYLKNTGPDQDETREAEL
jgi:hypothetical protein